MPKSASIILIVLFVSSSFAADTINRQPAAREGKAVRLDAGADSVNFTDAPVAASGAETRQSNYNLFGNPGSPNRRRCPLCDSSVFPYCGEKLFHDACCCTDPYEYPLPHRCRFADCAFLHANSCKEHRLISNCCCSDEYRSLLGGLGKSEVGTVATEKN